jgi:hypothetical protein
MHVLFSSLLSTLGVTGGQEIVCPVSDPIKHVASSMF